MKLIAPNEQGIYKHVASEIKMNPQIFQEWFHYQGKWYVSMVMSLEFYLHFYP